MYFFNTIAEAKAFDQMQALATPMHDEEKETFETILDAGFRVGETVAALAGLRPAKPKGSQRVFLL